MTCTQSTVRFEVQGLAVTAGGEPTTSLVGSDLSWACGVAWKGLATQRSSSSSSSSVCKDSEAENEGWHL